MKIGITLEINNNGIIVSIDDAKVIYSELSKIFDSTNIQNSIGKKTTKTNINKKEKTTDIKQEKENNILVETKPKISEYSNPIVEAAKKRAENRTSGCGARRN